jgi:hypothetical protein
MRGCILGESLFEHIPTPLQSATYYRPEAEDGYEALYRAITRQPNIIRPKRGKIRVLAPQRESDRKPGKEERGPQPPWNVPYERNIAFTGRDNVLSLLRVKLASNDSAAISQTLAISGLGGIGKTQTAVEYAYRYRGHYTAVLWVAAHTEQSLSSGFASLADLLGLHSVDVSDAGWVRNAVRKWLQDNVGWLLVLDNADEPALLPPYLPRQHRGNILITSRAHSLQRAGVITKPIILDVLSQEDATTFLITRTSRNLADVSELSAAADLASELDCFPLALEQAAAYINAIGCRFQDYLTSFKKRRLELLEKSPPLTGCYSNSIATVWAVSLEAAEESPISLFLLRLSAFLAPEHIPLDLLAAFLSQLKRERTLSLPDGDPVALDEVLEPLIRYSLARRHENDQTFSVHRLTQVVIRDSLGNEAERDWARIAVLVIDGLFPVRPGVEEHHSCRFDEQRPHRGGRGEKLYRSFYMR